MAQFHDLTPYSVAQRMAVLLLDNSKFVFVPRCTVPQDQIFYVKMKLHQNTWFLTKDGWMCVSMVLCI